MPKVLNIRSVGLADPPDNCAFIGRPTKYGNPFIIGRDGTREEVINKYKEYIEGDEALKKEAKKELKGKNLVCFCAPLPCHGDILLKIVNEEKT